MNAVQGHSPLRHSKCPLPCAGRACAGLARLVRSGTSAAQGEGGLVRENPMSAVRPAAFATINTVLELRRSPGLCSGQRL